MTKGKIPRDENNNEIRVMFNGKETTINKSVKKVVAATDQDQKKQWRNEEDLHKEREKNEKAEETETKNQDLYEQYELYAWDARQPAASLSTSTIKKKKKKRVKKSSHATITMFIKKFWVPFLSAVIVGLGLGFTVLLIFMNHKPVPVSATVGSQTNSVSSTSASTTPTSTTQSTVAGKDYMLNLQVVQTGYYDTKQSALTDQSKFEAMGVHAVLTTDSSHYALFSGLALTKNQLSILEPTIINKTPIYGKPWVLNPNKVKGTKKELQDLKTANLVIQNLIPLSLDAIQSKTVDSSILTQVNNALMQMADPSSVTSDKKLGTLKGSLLAAYTALTQTTPDGWKAQDALLDAVGNYQSIINSMVVNN